MHEFDKHAVEALGVNEGDVASKPRARLFVDQFDVLGLEVRERGVDIRDF